VPASHPLRPIRCMVDEALKTMSSRFDEIYPEEGRKSIPPERLLRALLLQMLYSVRSERMLMEQMEYNLLEAVDLCTTIPGIEAVAAANLIAEIGVNMDQFPSAAHLASWAGLCPGNNESAGKRLSGKARNGNVWLRRSLCQVAWAASHSKNTYLSSQFRRLATRKGKKRAIVAVGHTILVILFHMLKNHQPYRDLGADYFDRHNAEQIKRTLIRRLERLGLQVSVKPSSPISTPA